MSSRPLRVVLLGVGAINTRMVELAHARHAKLTIVGIIRRNSQRECPLLLEGAQHITTPGELASLSPDLIVEAASPDAVRQWGEHALSVARRVVLCSSSALVDDDMRARLIATAQRHGSFLVLSPGAAAGLDALAAAGRRQLAEVHHRIVKHPKSWPSISDRSAPCDERGATVLFTGSAREAARRYPENANVTVVTALAGLGLDKTSVELVSDPAATGNRHEIHARGEFGVLDVCIANRPLGSNPKSSELAALALLRLAENELSGVIL